MLLVISTTISFSYTSEAQFGSGNIPEYFQTLEGVSGPKAHSVGTVQDNKSPKNHPVEHKVQN